MAVVSRGRFVWHELMLADPKAVDFYQNVIGWTVMSWDHDPSYRMFAWKGVPMAGMMPLSDEARQARVPAHWISYVSVPDVDATVAQALSFGATTHLLPMNVPTVGRVAVLSDPQGATIGVFQPETQRPFSDDLVLGDFSWHEMVADDWKKAWEFYRALFGWEYDSQTDMGAMGTYWMFRRAGGSRTLGGMYNRPPDVPAAYWLPYVHVPSVDLVARLAAEHGGSVVHGPVEVPGGDRITIMMDPQGAPIAVHASKPADAATPEVKAGTGAQPKAAAKPRPGAKQAAGPKKAVKKAVKKAPARKAKAARPARRPVKKAAPRKRK
jgi:predicted enzyme related to lactoylglutathione lyase